MNTIFIGIAGGTGSGKTTLVDLILRTYNVPDGTVFIDDREVNDVSIRSVRAGCAYVPQDNFLFSDTIENNIAFGVETRVLFHSDEGLQFRKPYVQLIHFTQNFKEKRRRFRFQ